MAPPTSRIELLESRIARAGVSSIDVTSVNGSNGLRMDGTGANHYAGTSVSGAGDINGDGFAYFILSEYIAPPGSRTGRFFVVFGKAGGGVPATFNPLSVDGTNGFQISGTVVAGANRGIGVGSAGEVNGDGVDDILAMAAGSA